MSSSQPQPHRAFGDDSEASTDTAFERNWNRAKEQHKAKKRKKQLELPESSDEEEAPAVAGINDIALTAAAPIVVVDGSSTPTRSPPVAKTGTSTKRGGRRKKDGPPTQVSPPIVEPQCAMICTTKNCKKTLFRMCLGLKSNADEERPLGDIDVEPHKSCKQRAKFKSKNEELGAEIIRRCKIFGYEEQSSKSW